MSEKPFCVDFGSSMIKFSSGRTITEICPIYPESKPNIQLSQIPLTTRCKLQTPFSRGILISPEAIPSDFVEQLDQRTVFMGTEPLYPSYHAEKLTEFLFETCNVSSLFLTSCLKASATNSEFSIQSFPAYVVLDLGYEECTCAVFVFNELVEYSVRRTDAGGLSLDRSLKSNQNDNSLFGDLDNYQYLRKELRQQLYMNMQGYISISDSNFELEEAKSETRPNFKVLGHEMEGLIEGIFEPEKLGIMEQGIVQMVKSSVNSVPEAVGIIARENLVVCGGLANNKRVMDILDEQLVKTGQIGKILAQKEPDLTALKGLVAMGKEEVAVNRDLYYEYGKDIFYKRFM